MKGKRCSHFYPGWDGVGWDKWEGGERFVIGGVRDDGDGRKDVVGRATKRKV